jgi:uncharacterized membrane protein YdjX (TVP38/TMEM64 family)
MAESPPRPDRALLIKLAVALLLLLVGGVLVARGVNLRAWLEQGLDLVRSAGPVAFFSAMAVLPALGAPILAFSLTVGPAFGKQLGMPAVVGFSLLALLINMALSYFLARRALRPLLEKLFVRLGYRLPQATDADATDLIVLLRVTPGLPFPVQNYLLGLAEVPFQKYLVVSCLIVWTLSAAIILAGDALLKGRGRIALIALCLLLAFGAATHLLRKHYGKKKPT